MYIFKYFFLPKKNLCEFKRMPSINLIVHYYDYFENISSHLIIHAFASHCSIKTLTTHYCHFAKWIDVTLSLHINQHKLKKNSLQMSNNLFTHTNTYTHALMKFNSCLNNGWVNVNGAPLLPFNFRPHRRSHVPFGGTTIGYSIDWFWRWHSDCMERDNSWTQISYQVSCTSLYCFLSPPPPFF